VVARFALTLNATPPLSVAYLAAALDAAGHHVQVVDAVGEALDQFHPAFRDDLVYNGLTVDEISERLEPDTELVGISCLFSHEWPVICDLVQRIRQRFPEAVIVCGGEHATAAPEFSLRGAPALDACALGEGEETVVELADAVATKAPLSTVPGLCVRAADGSFVRTAPRARLRELDEIPLPRWDLTPLEAYLDAGYSFGVDRGRTVPILATRGCPYQCTFCSSPQMWTTRYYMRDPQRTVDEIEHYVDRYDARNIDFYDLTAIIKRDWILDFCRELQRRHLPITFQLPSGTRTEAIDREVAEHLYAAGCRNVSYAPESGSARTLELTKKKVKLERMLESMQASVEAGLNVKANILIGFPHERPEDLRATLRFILEMARVGVHDASVWTFAPYPGSELFESLSRAGRIAELDEDYFADLLSYSNLLGAVSYSEHLSAAKLERVRVAWQVAFYAASYLTHPSRPLRSIVNLIASRYESRMEMSLANLLRRLRHDRVVRRTAVRAAATGSTQA